MSGLNSSGQSGAARKQPTMLPDREGYELLVWRHLREFGGGHWDHWTDARLHFLPMIGYAYRAPDGALVGVGGVLWGQKNRPEGVFALTEEFRCAGNLRSRWVHRAAVEVLAVAHRISPVIYARVDDEIPGAQRWVERLGFKPPSSEEDGEFWRHDLVL